MNSPSLRVHMVPSNLLILGHSQTYVYVQKSSTKSLTQRIKIYVAAVNNNKTLFMVLNDKAHMYYKLRFTKHKTQYFHI